MDISDRGKRLFVLFKPVGQMLLHWRTGPNQPFGGENLGHDALLENVPGLSGSIPL